MKDYDFDTDHLHAYFDGSSDEDESLTCLDCDKIYSGKRNLHKHLLAHHIQQPVVKLDKIEAANPPLKITFKNRSGNSFEIVSPVPSPSSTSDPGSSSGKGLDEIPRSEERDDVFEEENFEFSITNFDEDEEAPSAEERSQESESGFEENGDQQSDFDPADPFAPLGSSDNNTQESAVGSISHSSGENSRDEERNVNFSPNLAEVIGGAFLADYGSPVAFDEAHAKKPEVEEQRKSDNTATLDSFGSAGDHAGSSPSYGSIPGAEPTPPPEPSPTCATEYPKLKVKTTGLFKDPEPPSNAGCTITEITDDNPDGEPTYNQYFPGQQNHANPIWTTPSFDDPLKLPDFLSSNDSRNKDMGYSSASSDSEFISLDSFNDRNRGAMQLYNQNASSAVATSSGSTLDSLTGLPMQALAQQVSRLTQNSAAQGGMHQQNVLINIQQFPTQPQGAPMNQPYQHQPPMYPPHPGYPPHQPPPMHQPYPYQPPNPMYPHYPPPGGHYPPAPPHMGPPPQMGGMQPAQGSIGPPQQTGQPPNSMAPITSQPQPMPPPNQIPQPPNSMQGGYRPPMPPNARAPAPRGPQPGASRMPGGPRGPNLINQRAPGMRPRAPMIRPRGAGSQHLRGGGQMRPRMSGPPQNVRGGVTSPLKRHPGPPQGLNNANVKRKRVDVLTPSDKDDDDCQVICMQPKNTGLPQIESVQGAESVENSIMKLSDSITLTSVRPQPKPSAVSPQKSETAKAVANVLASRGITVTSSGKGTKDASPTKQAPALPAGINLNGSISIVTKTSSGDALPTVDLTDEVSGPAPNSPNKMRAGLPYRCDLCPATYPNALGLNKHRQTYHKTNSGMCELGVPLVNLKTPGIMQKLSQVGINNYIPLQAATPEGTYAIPLINTKSPGNVAALGATQMLTLGPVRPISRPSNNVNSPTKKL